MSDVEGWLPWNPHTIEGEVFVLHLIRQWYCLWDLDMTRNSLERLDQELIMLSHTRQTQTAIKQVCMCISAYSVMDENLPWISDFLHFFLPGNKSFFRYV